jgi:hypothetical protein
MIITIERCKGTGNRVKNITQTVITQIVIKLLQYVNEQSMTNRLSEVMQRRMNTLNGDS